MDFGIAAATSHPRCSLFLSELAPPSLSLAVGSLTGLDVPCSLQLLLPGAGICPLSTVFPNFFQEREAAGNVPFPHEVLPPGPADSRGWVGAQWINSRDNNKLSSVDGDLIQSHPNLRGLSRFHHSQLFPRQLEVGITYPEQLSRLLPP